MTCFATCGHETSLEWAFGPGSLWTVSEEDGEAGVSYGCYCEACSKMMLDEGWGYKTEEEAWVAALAGKE